MRKVPWGWSWDFTQGETRLNTDLRVLALSFLLTHKHQDHLRDSASSHWHGGICQSRQSDEDGALRVWPGTLISAYPVEGKTLTWDPPLPSARVPNQADVCDFNRHGSGVQMLLLLLQDLRELSVTH